MSALAAHSILARVPLFSGLGEPQLAAVLELGVKRRVPLGTLLFLENAPASTLYVLLDGRVRVTRDATGGQIVVLHFADPGDVLGCAILGGARCYPGSAEVVDEAVMLAFDERAIAALVERFPLVSRNALRMLSGRMEDLRVRLRELATEKVERRVASALLRLAARAEADSKRPELRMSRQDLAELVGATQYTVSRIVAAWEKDGWVETGRQRIRVVDAEALRSVEHGEREAVT
ncbi:MAG: Crp/Fnr family transcriptional regulator [Pseudomonadota bacterium]|nr:Crp/Fnr family transcriptional regulator [Pseudomonadota bacterium]